VHDQQLMGGNPQDTSPCRRPGAIDAAAAPRFHARDGRRRHFVGMPDLPHGRRTRAVESPHDSTFVVFVTLSCLRDEPYGAARLVAARATRVVVLLLLACVAGGAAQVAVAPDTPLALVERLNADILASRSATATLEQWCRDHRLAATPRMTAHLVSGVAQPATAEQRRRLQVGAGDEVKYRHVDLQCGDRILSKADNWYVPGRLTADMNRLLDTTNTPFGAVVSALGPTRETFDVKLLWSGTPPVPDALFEHRAVLYTRDHQPFSEVHEIYQRQILAPPVEPPAADAGRRGGSPRM
jgi:chorismate-pyruvate lyase